MQKTQTNTLSNWTIWSPLKFAITSSLLSITGLLFALLLINAFDLTIAAGRSIAIAFPTFGLLVSIYLSLRKVPRGKMNHESFVAIQNAQMMLISTLVLFFLITSYAIIRANSTFVVTHPIISICASLLLLAASFYTIWLSILNLYAKFMRIRTMNVPMWKIFLSIPFGFTALWTPGYIIPDTTKKSVNDVSQPKWYKSITDWVISSPLHLSIGFIITTLLGAYAGIKLTLLTFIFAITCGIWAMQSGTKKFIKNIGNQYSTFSVIINWIIIFNILLSAILYAPGY